MVLLKKRIKEFQKGEKHSLLPLEDGNGPKNYKLGVRSQPMNAILAVVCVKKENLVFENLDWDDAELSALTKK